MLSSAVRPPLRVPLRVGLPHTSWAVKVGLSNQPKEPHLRQSPGTIGLNAGKKQCPRGDSNTRHEV